MAAARMSALHPVIQRIRQTRKTNLRVMAMSHRELVRYCDSLLTEEAAVEMLIGCFQPEWFGTGPKAR